jgi:soluble lytic murein transglycosylase-like protein
LALLASVSSMAQIYSGPTGADSAVVLSNFRSTETPLLLIEAPETQLVKVAPAPAADRSSDGASAAALRPPVAPAELNRLISDVAAQVQIAPELLHAVIAAESRYDPRAVSPRGAIGLMQLLPATAQRFGVRDPFVARENVMGGASYLKWLLALFQNDLELTLAAYNAGEQAVLKAGRRIPAYRETQAYVARVLAYLRCAKSPECPAA